MSCCSHYAIYPLVLRIKGWLFLSTILSSHYMLSAVRHKKTDFHAHSQLVLVDESGNAKWEPLGDDRFFDLKPPATTTAHATLPYDAYIGNNRSSVSTSGQPTLGYTMLLCWGLPFMHVVPRSFLPGACCVKSGQWAGV